MKRVNLVALGHGRRRWLNVAFRHDGFVGVCCLQWGERVRLGRAGISRRESFKASQTLGQGLRATGESRADLENSYVSRFRVKGSAGTLDCRRGPVEGAESSGNKLQSKWSYVLLFEAGVGGSVVGIKEGRDLYYRVADGRAAILMSSYFPTAIAVLLWP